MKVGLQFIPPLSFAATRMAMGAIILFAVAAALGELRFPDQRDMTVQLARAGQRQAGGRANFPRNLITG